MNPYNSLSKHKSTSRQDNYPTCPSKVQMEYEHEEVSPHYRHDKNKSCPINQII